MRLSISAHTRDVSTRPSIVVGGGRIHAVEDSLSAIPESSPMRSPVAYKISDQSAATLRNTGIPPEVMKKIGPIINQELFGAKPFDDAIKARLGYRNPGEAPAKPPAAAE